MHGTTGSGKQFDVAEFANDGEEEAEPLPVEDGADEDAPFDTSFNFSFDFGLSEEISTIAPENARGSDEAQLLDATSFNPFAPVVLKESVGQKKNGDPSTPLRSALDDKSVEGERPAFRKPGDKATLPELIKRLGVAEPVTIAADISGRLKMKARRRASRVSRT